MVGMESYIFYTLFVLLLFPLAFLCYSIAQQLQAVGEILQQLRTVPLPDTATEEKNTDALRLQACERLTLMLERINVSNLLLRMPPPEGSTAKEYTATLLLSIRQEFEYNVTQQIYVSDQLWRIVLAARENISQLIVRAAEGAESAGQVAGRLRLMSSRQPEDAIVVGQAAIRREASLVIGK